MGFIKNFFNKLRGSNKISESSNSSLTDGKENDNNLKCPNCKYDKWYEGPSGGMSTNIQCGNCGKWYNHTPFGLDFIRDVEETKRYERNKKIDDLIK